MHCTLVGKVLNHWSMVNNFNPIFIYSKVKQLSKQMTDAGRQVLIIAIVITEKQRGRKSSMTHVVYQYKLNIDKDGYM